MKATINRRIINCKEWDSARPGPLSALVHQFEEGQYRVRSMRGEREAYALDLMVQKEGRNTQLEVDLTGAKRAAQQTAGPEGWVVFTGDGKCGVEATRLEDSRAQEFDSRTLGEGDRFALTLIRPGTYALENKATGRKAKVVVSYPTISRTPYRPPEPVTVNCTREGFEVNGGKTATVDLKPAQGLVFTFAAPSRLSIELSKPDDGPRGVTEPGAKPRVEATTGSKRKQSRKAGGA